MNLIFSYMSKFDYTILIFVLAVLIAVIYSICVVSDIITDIDKMTSRHENEEDKDNG